MPQGHTQFGDFAASCIGVALVIVSASPRPRDRCAKTRQTVIIIATTAAVQRCQKKPRRSGAVKSWEETNQLGMGRCWVVS